MQADSSVASKPPGSPTPQKKSVRASSLPAIHSSSTSKDPSEGWTQVAHKSRTKLVPRDDVSPPQQIPLTSQQLEEEDALVKVAQDIIRKRLAALDSSSTSSLSGVDMKTERRHQRHRLRSLVEDPSFDEKTFSSQAFALDCNMIPVEQAPPSPSSTHVN